MEDNYLISEFEKILDSGQLESIRVFNVNNPYFELKQEGQLIVDAGIELNFLEGTFLLAWSTDKEMLSFGTLSFKSMYKMNNFHEVSENIDLGSFVGKKLKEYKIKSKKFEFIVDYTMKTVSEEKIVEVVLRFYDESVICLAMVDFDLDHNGVPSNYRYFPEGQILIRVNNDVVIK